MSDMPDFDSMSPEEITRWMESLAKRQGATEGLTTSADMEVGEVSAEDERLAGQGEYIPYGWSKDKWEEHLAKERAQKEAKQVAQPKEQPPAAPPQPTPQPPAPTAQAAPSGEMDLENMSPEDMMRWMESLAKRQGATEGLTTTADMEVEEVSAEDERLAGKGDYIPFGWSEDRWKEHLAKEQTQKETKQAAPQPVKEEADEEFGVPSLEDIFGGDNELPPLEDLEEDEFDLDLEGIEEEEAVTAQNPMDWLAGLAGTEEEEPAAELDFDMDALGDLASLGENQAENPMDWLAGLAGTEEEEAEAEPADEGSLAWLESLAKRQGADSEELVTDANLDIPEGRGKPGKAPGYEPYSFESGTGEGYEEAEEEAAVPSAAGFDFDQLELDDPESWLDSLAAGVAGRTEPEEEFDLEGLEFEEEDEAITQEVSSKINRGEDVSEQEIQAFFEAQFRKAEKRDVPDYLEDEEEEELVEAEIPEWLRESLSAAQEPTIGEMTEGKIAPTDTAEMMVAELGLEEEGTEEIPDWLSGGMETAEDLSDIFAGEEAAAEPQIDTDDSWVQAFVEEESGELAEWYDQQVRRIEGGEAPAAPEPAAQQPAAGLKRAELPVETELPAGQPQAMPGWMRGEAVAQASMETPGIADVEEEMPDWLMQETTAASEEMPDWLREQVDDTVAPAEVLPDWLSEAEELEIAPEEIPDWLRETMEEEHEPVAQLAKPEEIPKPKLPEPEEEAYPLAAQPQPKQIAKPETVSPAPVPAAAAAIDAQGALQSARGHISSGELAAALNEYEAVIRANTALDAVVTDLNKLTESAEHKKEPAVYRLLGDTLMRQGKLQQALDTYRKALNLL